MTLATSALFQPIRVGAITLQHRIVMAPLTRLRADKDHVHGELARRYYEQRATVPGTLIITEATFIAPQAGGSPHVPGIWSDAQIAGWKAVTNAVHAKGSFAFLQLWALGRAADANNLKSEGGYDVVAPSPIPLGEGQPIPRELTIPEISEYVGLYATAAKNAIQAGFDGVEIHSANGYLLDQFLQSVSNERTDEYGGSVENRVRFPLAVVDAVVKAVGAERTGIRLSPWSAFQKMGMKDPIPTFSKVVEHIRDTHPDFAYIHVVQPRINGNVVLDVTEENAHQSNDSLRDAWGNRPYIAAGGLERESATDLVEKKGGLVAFGRHFISNPDLPLRLRDGLELTKYDRSTFYKFESADGYTDYPFAIEVEPVQA